MAICSISSTCTLAEHRYGAPSTRSSRSSHCRRPARQWRRSRRRLRWHCRPINGTHVEAYLHARAIGHCRFPAPGFHPNLIHRGDDGIHRLLALAAAVTGDNGAIEDVQRTWLDPERPATIDLARPRKALGLVYGRATTPSRPVWPLE